VKQMADKEDVVIVDVIEEPEYMAYFDVNGSC
jgi:hypothetical protein